MINLAEIIVANGTGMFLVAFLTVVRMKRTTSSQLSDKLFNLMTAITFITTLSEMMSFLLDGHPGPFNRFLLLISNAFTIFGAPVLSCVWCMYVDYKLHRNIKRLKKRAWLFAIPAIIDVAVCLTDCIFNTGIVFRITDDNVYERGSFIAISICILMLYFAMSVINYMMTNAIASERQFFPVFSFLFPCLLGMIVQAISYGIALGWLGVSIALVFVYIQLQTQTNYVDSLSGLFNRRYMEQYVSGFEPHGKPIALYGVMIDVNGFKKINDTWGHSMGDDAIVTLGNILAESADVNDIVTRFAGDEFILLSKCENEESIQKLFERINKGVETFNTSTSKPYRFSLAMGYGKYRPGEESVDEFLKDIDEAMYITKEQFYKKRENERRS